MNEHKQLKAESNVATPTAKHPVSRLIDDQPSVLGLDSRTLYEAIRTCDRRFDVQFFSAFPPRKFTVGRFAQSSRLSSRIVRFAAMLLRPRATDFGPVCDAARNSRPGQYGFQEAVSTDAVVAGLMALAGIGEWTVE